MMLLNKEDKESREYMKYLSLVVLAVQNTMTVLVGKYATSVSPNEKFIMSTVVILSEAMKLLICVFVINMKTRDKPLISKIYEELFVNYSKTLKISVPSFLYVVQNNLLLVGLTHLEAAVFQVSYQLKILTTAVMSVLMLGRKLSLTQWLSLLILFTGVVMVNVNTSGNKGSTKTQANATNQEASVSPIVGLTAVVVSCMTSAFSGVYFEKIIKNERSDLFISNLQLSFSGVIFSFLNCLYLDRQKLLEKGFFYGYNASVFFYILLQAFGGLVVAVVVKYADNILKGFATSVAIILSSVLSYFIFSFTFTALFILGTTLVISSIFLYSYGQKK